MKRIQIRPIPAQCRLCNTPGNLARSHIIPDFFIRSLERDDFRGKLGLPQKQSILLSTRPEVDSGARDRGYWEKRLGVIELLLCKTCEGMLSKHEGWFRKFFYEDGTPLKKRTLGTVLATNLGNRVSELRKIDTNYQHLRLFALSLLWRASVARGEFLRSINLGNRHEGRIANLLLSNDPGEPEEYTLVMANISIGTAGIEDVIEQPLTHKAKGESRRAASFVLGGFQLLIDVSAKGHLPPEEMVALGLKKDGSILIPTQDRTGYYFGLAKQLKDAGAI